MILSLGKKGRFVFSDMPLETIANQLERWYDVEIRFDDTVAKYYRFTGVMKRYNELRTGVRLNRRDDQCQIQSGRAAGESISEFIIRKR